MVPRKRTRTYSFSGSERSHTATPTPSEAEITGEDESQQSQDNDTDKESTEHLVKGHATSGHTQIEEDLEPPPPLPEKSDLEDELLPDAAEDAEAKTMEAKPASEKAPEVSNLTGSNLVKANDRAAASPPCEVSSTTLNNEEKKQTENKTEVVAETSETVVIEGSSEVIQDEEEIGKSIDVKYKETPNSISKQQLLFRSCFEATLILFYISNNGFCQLTCRSRA